MPSEKELMKRINTIYNAAFKESIKRNEAFLKKVEKAFNGKIKPPAGYTDEQKKKWLQGFIREALREYHVSNVIEEQIHNAGLKAKATIKTDVEALFGEQYKETAHDITAEAEKFGINATFADYDPYQIDILLTDTQPAFSKIAYQNLGQNKQVVHRLQNELALATILGEDQRQIIKRIRNVVGNASYNAKRTAQTERNRVQSQARSMAITEANDMGIVTKKKWTCRFVNSRETHMHAHGEIRADGEKFSNGLLYPGDPSGSAAEVINCHCVLVPVVAMPQKAQNAKKLLTPEAGKDIIKGQSIHIFRSLSARALNYDVMDLSTGKMYRFVEGTDITDIIIFAGKGSNTPYHKAYKYSKKYGGKEKDWKHVKGKGWIETENGNEYAEVHWSECEGRGRHDFFVKRWLDESEAEE